MKEPVPEREPAAGRGREGPLTPLGTTAPSQRGRKTHPQGRGLCTGQGPVGAELSLQPPCHPPPPGKGQGCGGAGATVAWDPVGIVQILGAPELHMCCWDSPGWQEG